MTSGAGKGSKPRAPRRTTRPDVRTALDADSIERALYDNLYALQAKLPQHATRNDWYMALAYTVRDRLLSGYIQTVESITNAQATKVVAYLSAEFLTGPHLGHCLICLGIWPAVHAALARAGQDLTNLLDQDRKSVV